MSWEWLFGRKRPQYRASHIEATRRTGVAPVDPTLEAAANEQSDNVDAKVKRINELATDIVSMTSELLKQFEGNNEHRPK